MSWRWLGIPGILIAAAGIWGVSRWWQAEQREQQRAAREETELQVGLVPPARRYDLWLAGKNLAEARLLSAGAPPRLWLPPGNYMVRAELPGATWFYPAPLTGYRSGPDRGGAFILTVRPAPDHTPATLPGEPPFVYVPSGHFLIGDRLNPRAPHHVWLPAYFIGSFEVTNAEFRAFLQDHPELASATSAHLKPSDREYARFGKPDYPVTNVSWREAAAYCRWRTGRHGQGRWIYALPSDAEWEKAARGPDQFDYGLGMSISDRQTGFYNWKKNPDAAVTVVGWEETRRSYPPNRYGLFHASGNVWEWTASAFWPYTREKPYTEDKRNAPDLSDQRTARGGSWYSASIALLQLGYRDAFLPDHRGNDLGFRLAAKARP